MTLRKSNGQEYPIKTAEIYFRLTRFTIIHVSLDIKDEKKLKLNQEMQKNKVFVWICAHACKKVAVHFFISYFFRISSSLEWICLTQFWHLWWSFKNYNHASSLTGMWRLLRPNVCWRKRILKVISYIKPHVNGNDSEAAATP